MQPLPAALALLVLASLLRVAVPGAGPPLPRRGAPALTPDEAKKTIQVAGGLEIQLLAHEPMVRQPVCITFDDRGRLWVLQYLQYPTPAGLEPVEVDQYLRTRYDRVPEPPPKGPRGADKITVLEDPDGDGRYRKSTDVITGLNLASGMALGYGGVFVAQPPYLLFYRLQAGADRPAGDPEVLLKGFGMEDAHAFANSLTWGPDGWLYGCQGSTVTANIRGVEFQQGVWRYHPRTKEFELFAEGGGNTWGIDFDRHGQLFAGGNTTEPLCHHVQGGYYVKGFGKHGPLHDPYTFGYINPVKHQGFLGSALTGGFVLYQGGLFPDRFRDAVIYPNLRANAMRVSRLEPSGSTFTTRFQEDFLTSSDRSFRPVKGLVGPDGALYVADWYDDNISHTDPKDRSRWYQPTRDTGRLWRVAPSDGRARGVSPPLALSKRSSDELIDLLNHPNAWYAREARRVLMERRDPAVRPRLAAMVLREKGRLALEALWALHVSDGLTDELAMKLLDHPFEHVRAWIVRLLGDRRRVDPRFDARLVELARRDPSATVRSQLACTCKRLPGPVALPVVEQLLARTEDAADPHVPLLLWWAVEDKAVSDRALVLKLAESPESWTRPILRSFVAERLARRWLAEGTPEGFRACARLFRLAPMPADRDRLIQAMEQQVEGLAFEKCPEPLATALKPLLEDEQPGSALVRLALRLGLDSAYPLAAARAADARLGASERADFIRLLGDLRRPATLPALLDLLAEREPAPVRAAALLALQRYATDRVAAEVIKHYPTMTPALKVKARDVLVSRSTWAAAALTAATAGGVPAKDFSTEQVRRIILHADPRLTARVEKVWGQVRPATSRQKQGRIMAVSQILGAGTGDASRGKPLAVKLCLNCHQLFGEGEKVGPDLTAADRKNLEVLLPNVLDPSAVIREGYQQYVVASADGRVLQGLLAEDTAEKLTVLDARGERSTLRKKDVESLKRSEASLMPEDSLDALSDQEVRDLFAFLRSEPRSPGESVDWPALTQKPHAGLAVANPGLRPLLVDREGKKITTKEGWEKARAGLRDAWLAHLGKPPAKAATLDVRVEKTEKLDGFTRRLLSFASEGDDRIRAYLLVPDGLARGEKRPAAVVFHETTRDTLNQPVGLGKSKELALALELTRRGYVTLSPECHILKDPKGWAAGQAAELAKRRPGWTGMGKMTFDAARCIDYLETVPEVDREKIGCVGFSLGAKEVLYAMAFDPRYKAGVFNEGGIGLRMSNWTDPWYLTAKMKERIPAEEHHQVLAFVAPRPLLIMGGDSADGDASWPFVREVLPVYGLYGAGDRVGLINHRGKHAFPREARQTAYRWLDHWLGHAPRVEAKATDPVIITVAKADDKHVRHSEGTAVELKDGRLMLAWIEFTKGEGDSDFFPARIVARTSKDGGKTWGDHRVLARPEAGEISAFSPNLLRLKDGRLLFVYMRYLSFAKAKNKYPPATTVAMISEDDGKTFSRVATILDEQPVTVCSHSLKQLASGRIVLPLNRDLSKKGEPDHWEAGVAFSDDGGKTWKQSDDWVDAPRRGAMEPHVEEVEANQLLMVMRTQMGAVYRAESSDGGKTWSKATALGVEAPESCPELCKVPGTGDLLLVWNGARYDPKWPSHFGKRTPLSTAVSKDGGRTWSKPRHVETDAGWAFSNPGAYFTSKGTLFLNYWACKYTDKGFMSNYPIDLKAAIVESRWLYGE